jgi:hypothetical protein
MLSYCITLSWENIGILAVPVHHSLYTCIPSTPCGPARGLLPHMRTITASRHMYCYILYHDFCRSTHDEFQL